MKAKADCDSDTDGDTDKDRCAGQAMHWNFGLKGRKKDNSGRSPEIREPMNESPERAKEAGNFLLFRPCQACASS